MSALDHFRLVTKSVETLRGSIPFAHATPLRTAITAAATAVWAMADDEDTRLKRAAVLSFHDAENARKYVNGRPVDKVAGIDEARSALHRRSDYFADMALEFGEDVRRDRWRPTADFAMVEAASKGMPEWSGGWSPRTEVPSQWRLLSCYAHGMGWATARHVEYGEPDEIGLAKSTLVFDLDDLMSSASIVRLLIERALDRYREMAGYPESTNAELTKILHESMNRPGVSGD
ncbi:hypothetical protein ABH922_005733 [Rhodococcus sp. 27YEA15]|uniref:hypothetical protein n=1 Tax=Rhodococcus sp. 27YEA15 TaxID=3156259 RepID=UPI003C7D5E2F